MTGHLFHAIRTLAEQRGVELAPDWLDAVQDQDLGGDEADLAEACRQLGWKPPRRLSGRPRPGNFPLLMFSIDRGWAVAEQWEATDIVRVAPPETSRTIDGATVFYDVSLPRMRTAETGQSAVAVFRRALWARRPVFYAAIVATITINIIALATSLYSMQVYDRVIPRSGFSTLWVLTLGVIFALGLDFALRTVRALMIEREAAQIDAEVSETFFSRALAIRLDALPTGIGTTAAQLKGWEQIRSLLSSIPVFLIADLPFALFFIIVVAILGGVIALVPLMSLVVALLLALVFSLLIRADADRAQVTGNRKNGMLVESLDAAETVKANRGAWHLLARWNRLNDEVHLHDQPVRRWSSIASNVFSTLQQTSYILLVAWGAVQVSTGEMTMGALIACTILSGRVNGPLVAQLPGLMVQWSYARSSIQALDALMALPVDQKPGVRVLRPDRLEPSLRMDSVKFTYPGFGVALAIDIPRLEIKAGERVAVIGGVGSGKSTLLKLLGGLYAPAEGVVSIGGLEISQVAPDVLRRHLGYLPQDTRLLNGTLRDNLLLGLAHPGDDAVRAALEECRLASLVAGHPQGLDLPISEGGRGLSGGQRTLANLTRLFLADPDLWLLDEPTANLDQATETAVLAALSRRMKEGRTLVLITHRMQLLSLAQRLIVMAGGRIVRDGPTQDVIAELRQSRASTPVQD